jgi:predicted nucleic acid-binding protein
MTAFVDTNVIIDVIRQDGTPEAEWSMETLSARKESGPILVSDIVFSELCYTMPSAQAAAEALHALDLTRLPFSDEALFLAAKAFRSYKEDNKGEKLNVLPDFLIGAMAAASGAPLLTRDPKRVRTYFPQVELVCPTA